MADVVSTLRGWSATPGSNLPAGTTTIGTGLDDNIRELQAVVRKYLASAASNMASATTVDLSTADGYYINITGTTTITALGTESAGISYLLVFAGALTFTHNATSLILPGGESITTSIGDTALMMSLGSGNWKCVMYQRVSDMGIERNYIAGLTMSTAGASATMSIAAGVASDSANVAKMQLAATSKTTSAWALGAAAGGLDTGVIANSTWYHFYVIRRPDTGVVDAVFSTSASSPTLPTNYTQYRRIGSGKTNGSAQWTAFTQVGDRFRWVDPVADIAAANPGTAAVTRTLTVPTGVVVHADIQASIALTSTAGSTAGFYISPLTETDTAATSIAVLQGFAAPPASGTAYAISRLQIATNTSSQVRSRIGASDAQTTLGISTMGWIDQRGKDA